MHTVRKEERVRLGDDVDKNGASKYSKGNKKRGDLMGLNQEAIFWSATIKGEMVKILDTMNNSE